MQQRGSDITRKVTMCYGILSLVTDGCVGENACNEEDIGEE
jgi:hypothetical protein